MLLALHYRLTRLAHLYAPAGWGDRLEALHSRYNDRYVQRETLLRSEEVRLNN